MIIVLKDLQVLCTFFLTNIQKDWAGKVTCDTNLYWDVCLSDAYNFEEDNLPLGVGSLMDDWEWLEKILHKKNRSTTTDFDRLGSVVTFLGYSSFFPLPEEDDDSLCLISNADVLKLCLQFLSKSEDAEFKEIKIAIDAYKLIAVDEVFDLAKKPTQIIQSFVDDWLELKSFDFKRELTAKDFERLGRTIKVIGESIRLEERARTNAGLNFLFSPYDDPEEPKPYQRYSKKSCFK